MRITFFILLFLLNGKLFSQSVSDSTKQSDSLKFIYPTQAQIDSLPYLVPSATNLYIPSLNNPGPIYIGEIPNCGSLNMRGDILYLAKDTIPYCGQCVVLYNGNKNSITYINRYPSGNNFYAYYSQYLMVVDRVKIVSNYDRGKRHGEREYYNEQGKLVKIEFYVNGVLTETTYTKK